jgi:transglutaminase-like putative cysteine protease
VRFGLVHRVMTDALAFLGVLALVVSGQFSRPLAGVMLATLGIAIALKEPWRQRASQRHFDAISTALLIAVQLGRGFFTPASILDILIEFAVGLQVIRVATRNGAAHDQQVIVLALLHLIAGTVVGGGLGYGLCFVGLLVVTPGALVLSHLRREVEGNYRQGARDRTGLPVDVPRILRSKRVVGKQFIAVTCLLSLPILLFTATLFVVFPRVGLSLLLLQKPRGERMIGFSGTVNLGQIGTLRSDPTIALRVSVPGLPDPPPPRRMMYLRGTALDQYDGRTWTQSSKSVRSLASAGELVPISGTPSPAEAPWRVELEPFEPPVLFVTPTTKALELTKSGNITPGLTVQLQTGPEGEFRYQAPSDRMVRYDLYPSESGAPNFTRLRSNDRPRYLQIPPELPTRVVELAAEWTREATSDLDRAKAIEQRLRSDYRYDLASPSGSEAQPLDHFLFESKRGHCEYFSTAMAVMLRSVQVPTRNVTGFVGGTYNKYGNFYAVRQGDAHSWVEAFIEGRGWISFDPTPPGFAEPQSDVDGALASLRDFFEAISQRWNQNVLGYDLAQQVSLFDTLSLRDSRMLGELKAPRGRAVAALVGLALVGGGLYWLYRRRRHEAARRGVGPKASREALVAARLYRLLDRAMTAAGVKRLESVPPLRHAVALEERGHPLSSEIRALTERYLSARYGNQPLSEEEQRDFERRTRWLQQAPHGTHGSSAPERARRDSTADRAIDAGRGARRPSSPDTLPVATIDTDDDRVAVVAGDDFPDSAIAPPVVPYDEATRARRTALETPTISINVDLGDEPSPTPPESETD